MYADVCRLQRPEYDLVPGGFVTLLLKPPREIPQSAVTRGSHDGRRARARSRSPPLPLFYP